MNLKGYYNNQLIKNKIFFLTMIIMISVSGISIAAVQFAMQMYEKKIYSEAAQVLNLSSAMVDSELQKIESLSFQILGDKMVQEYLSAISNDQTDYDYFKTKDILLERLLELSRQEKSLAAIQLNDNIGNENQLALTARFRLDTQPIVEQANRSSGSIVWMKAEKEQNLLIAARQIRQMKGLSLNNLGTLIMYIDLKRFSDLSLDLSNGRIFLIEYDDGVVLSTSNDISSEVTRLPLLKHQGYQIANIGGRMYFIAHLTSTYHSFTYFNILPYNHIFYPSKWIKYGLIGLYGFLFLLAVYFGRLASKTISRPLENLSEKMKQVQKGNFDTAELFPEENLNMDETGQIHRHFRVMLEQINELIRENYAKQLAVNESEYMALQAQINPHFLYNTLESINWMAKVNEQGDISKMVESLGRLLRGIISNKQPLIPIEEELRIVGHYITIQQIRFGTRLQFRLVGDEPYRNYCIPKLTLQPLVENAIQHGLEVMSGACLIEITFEGTEEFIEITVKDNGPGMDTETMSAIHMGTIQPKGTGIGLKNIRDRIKLLFSDAYDVSIESAVGKGTTLKIRIPYSLEGEYV